MTTKQHQEFETWLVDTMEQLRIGLTGASPTGLEAQRQVLDSLKLVHAKFVELSGDKIPAPEPTPKPAPSVHPTPTPKTKSSH
jgi:hypothetical protein